MACKVRVRQSAGVGNLCGEKGGRTHCHHAKKLSCLCLLLCLHTPRRRQTARLHPHRLVRRSEGRGRQRAPGPGWACAASTGPATQPSTRRRPPHRPGRVTARSQWPATGAPAKTDARKGAQNKITKNRVTRRHQRQTFTSTSDDGANPPAGAAGNKPVMSAMVNAPARCMRTSETGRSSHDAAWHPETRRETTGQGQHG